MEDEQKENKSESKNVDHKYSEYLSDEDVDLVLHLSDEDEEIVEKVQVPVDEDDTATSKLHQVTRF